MNIVAKYGWICLLIAVVGDMVVPFVLALFYKGYTYHYGHQHVGQRE